MLIPILILSIVLRLISLNQSFWLDEAAQATLSAQNLLKINWAADFQPPGFYVLTHLWQRIGIHTEWFLRLPSVFFGVATIYLIYIFVKDTNWRVSEPGEPQKRRNENEHYLGLGEDRPRLNSAIIASILLATAPYHIYYSQEYRMYSAVTFLVTLSWYFLWKEDLKKYAFVVFLSVFTHYFAFLAIIAQITYVFIAKRGLFKQFIFYIGIGLFPFIIWIRTFIEQIRTAGTLLSTWPEWGGVAGSTFLKLPFLVLAKFTVGHISPNKLLYSIFVLFVGSVFIISFIRILSGSNFKFKILNSKLLFLTWFFIPLLLSWISSLWMTGNAPHRLLFVLPAFYAIVGIGLSKGVILREKTTEGSRLSTVFRFFSRFDRDQNDKSTMILFVTLLCSNIYFSGQYLLKNSNHRENWRSAVAYTDKKTGTDGVILTEYVGPWAPMAWYSKSPDRYLGASTDMKITQKSVSQKLDSILDTRNSILLYTYLSDITDPNHLVEKYLTDHNFKLTEEKDFRGVGIIKTYTIK